MKYVVQSLENPILVFFLCIILITKQTNKQKKRNKTPKTKLKSVDFLPRKK